ncbi:MAG: hypothetical protein NVSMB38_29090 [Ktedonobacteraceae bacterium]
MDNTTPPTMLFVHAHSQGATTNAFERRTLFSLEDTQGRYALLLDVQGGSERVTFPPLEGCTTCYVARGAFTFFQDEASSDEAMVANQGDLVVLADSASSSYERDASSGPTGELLILLTPPSSSVQPSRLIQANEGQSYAVLTDIGTIKLGKEDTNGAYLVMVWRVPPLGGAALHAQSGQETFFILEGNFAFRGLHEGQPYTLEAKQGDVVHAQERVPHSYQNSGESPGTMFVVMSPVGRSQEFFQEIGTPSDGTTFPTTLPDLAFLLPILQKYNLDIFV